MRRCWRRESDAYILREEVLRGSGDGAADGRRVRMCDEWGRAPERARAGPVALAHELQGNHRQHRPESRRVARDDKRRITENHEELKGRGAERPNAESIRMPAAGCGNRCGGRCVKRAFPGLRWAAQLLVHPRSSLPFPSVLADRQANPSRSSRVPE